MTRFWALAAAASLASPLAAKDLAYSCDGIGTRVSAEFIDGDPPHVTLAWGSQILTLAQSPAGSGSYYANDTSEFWIKGDEALLIIGDVKHRCTTGD